MPEETTIVTQTASTSTALPKGESAICGISIRAILVIMVVATLCLLQLLIPVLGYLVDGSIVIEIKEPFYSVVGMSVAFYFGQKNSNK